MTDSTSTLVADVDETLKDAFARLISTGASAKKAAADLGLDEARAYALLSEPTFKDRIRAAIPSLDDIRLRFLAAASLATDRAIDLMTSAESEKVQAAMVKEILAQAGVAHPVREASVTLHLDVERVDFLKATLKEVS